MEKRKVEKLMGLISGEKPELKRQASEAFFFPSIEVYKSRDWRGGSYGFVGDVSDDGECVVPKYKIENLMAFIERTPQPSQRRRRCR